MTGIILNGLLLQRLIERRWPSQGQSRFIAEWQLGGGSLDPSTLHRWMHGSVPSTEERLLRLAALLDVDVFALLTFDRGAPSNKLDALLSSFQNGKLKQFNFFASFFGRQNCWPPEDISRRYFRRAWHTKTFRHDPSNGCNYYAKLCLDSNRKLRELCPHTFHFAFRQQGAFADRWLQYGYVVRTEREARLLHINGYQDECMAIDGDSPALVETFFGPSPVEFCVASLHPFELRLSEVEEHEGFGVRFPA